MLGQDFHQGVCVCLQAPSDDSYPKFACVTQVLVPEGSKLLLVRLLKTDSYSQHRNAYCVSMAPDYAIISITELALHDVFTMYTISSVSYMIIRSCCHVEMFV